MAQLSVLYRETQRRTTTEPVRDHCERSANKFEAEELRRDIDHISSLRVTVAVLIAIAAMVAAMMGLKHVTALREST